MTTIKRKIIMLIIVLLSLDCVESYGYGKNTHEQINKKIYESSVMDTYFSQHLNADLETVLFHGNKLAIALFEQGGKDEDSPFFRTFNHFHNPLKEFGEAGFTKALLPDGISSILWAQYDLLRNFPWIISGPNEDWTWQKAYSYFLAGLTAPDEAARDENLGNLFLALGHLTHLVADASVPEHSRNDAHFFRNYETWCKEKLTKLESTAVGKLAFRNEFAPEPAIFAQSLGSAFGSGYLSPVSNLWDSYVYAEDNPLLGVAERRVGLADYSNYNYFSGDTVFETDKYPHPSHEEVGLSLVAVTAKDGQTDYVVYFNRLASDDIFVEYLAAADFLYSELQNVEPGQEFEDAHLDDRCYEDYASNLVPRAVSYGTALVDYFFRGRLNVTAEGDALTVENLSSGSASGIITVYADAADGTRSPVQGFINWPVNFGPGGAQNASVTIGGFSPPVTEGLQYTLVFGGMLGNAGLVPNQDYTVAARVFTWNPGVQLPSTWRSHSSSLIMQGYMMPFVQADLFSSEPVEGQRIGCSCHFVHGSPYPIQLADDMTNLELCKDCHGLNAVGNYSPNWSPPRVLLSPDAVPPDFYPLPDEVATFNPKNNEVVSGKVQFLLAVFDDTHHSASPVMYRMEVWSADGSSLIISYPAGPFEDLFSGWKEATAMWFLRDWDYPEKLVWDSTTVENGTYLLRFYPISNPEIYNPPRVGNPAELILTVQNGPSS